MTIQFSKSACRLGVISLLSLSLWACGGSSSNDNGGGSGDGNPPPVTKLVATADTADGVSNYAGAAAVVNVLANDTLDGNAAATSNVNLSVVTEDSAGVLSLNDDGTVDVAAGQAPGSYTLEYQICEAAATSNCARASVNVTTVTLVVSAADDSEDNVYGPTGASGVLNVLANDTFNGAPATVSTVDLSQVNADPDNVLSLNADGSVDVAAGSANGSYSLSYQICEPGTNNCASAQVTVAVVDVLSGVLEQGWIKGLAYATETESGMTGDKGEFHYHPDETIQFSLGGIAIGQAVAVSEQLALMDLMPNVVFPVTAQQFNRFNNQRGKDYGLIDELDKQHQLINALILLYAVDKDKDYHNGIEIDPGIHNIYQTMPADTLKARFGEQKKVVRIKLFEAYGDGFVANARLFDWRKALHEFAKLKGLEPQIYLTKSKIDRDGTRESVRTAHWDSQGLVERIDWYADEYSEFSFDEFGEILQEAEYKNGALVERTTFTYNAHGLKQRTFAEAFAVGDEDSWSDYEYDGFGNLVKRVNGGKSDSINLYGYDARGNRTFYEIDRGADGTVDFRSTTTYDAHDNITSTTQDDGDGVIDYSSKIEYEYNAQNRILSKTTDHGNDGTIDQILRYSYDGLNRRTSLQQDNDGDGNFDYSVYDRQYDAMHNIVHLEYDTDGDGVIDASRELEYGQYNNLLSSLRDEGNDGSWDHAFRYEYDANGNKTRYTKDDGNDGVIEEEQIFEYQLGHYLGLITMDQF